MFFFFASYFRLTPVLLLKSEWVFENIPQVQMSPFLHSQHDSTFGGRRCKVRYTVNLGFHIWEIWKISKLTLKCSLLRGALYKAHPNGSPNPETEWLTQWIEFDLEIVTYWAGSECQPSYTLREPQWTFGFLRMEQECLLFILSLRLTSSVSR
jgi:hypothetical protein